MRKLGWLVAATAVTYGGASDSKDPPAGGQTDEIGAQASDQHGVEVSGSPAPRVAGSTTAAPGTVPQRVQHAGGARYGASARAASAGFHRDIVLDECVWRRRVQLREGDRI